MSRRFGTKGQSETRVFIATILGISVWGLSGTAAQALFQKFNFPVVGLLSLRLICSGAIILAAMRPAKPRRSDLSRLIPIAVFGFMGSQFTYLAAIQNSNAPTATLLQFLFLPIVASYEALTGAIKWSARWTLVIALAIVGTLLLIGIPGYGSIHLLVTLPGLTYGLLAAVSAAFYALYSRPIVKKEGPWWLTTWGFLIAGAISLPFGALSLYGYAPPSSPATRVDILLLVLFVIVFGTIIAYGSFLSGLQKLTATEVGVISSLEPITAAIAAYAFLGVILTNLQYFGGALILAAVILIALGTRAKIQMLRS
jgi:drug/metabolite transporter (DMT)-like permease